MKPTIDRTRRLFLILAAVLALMTGCRSTRQAEVPAGPHVRVLTYIVNWGAPGPDLAADIIRQSGADIVCLQETTPQWEQFLRRELAADYSLVEFRNSKMRMAEELQRQPDSLVIERAENKGSLNALPQFDRRAPTWEPRRTWSAYFLNNPCASSQSAKRSIQRSVGRFCFFMPKPCPPFEYKCNSADFLAAVQSW